MTVSDLSHPGRTRPASAVRIRARLRRFLRTTHAGATSIVALAVAIMTVGSSALIVDHNWLYDQRDALKYASDAAAVASTIELERHRSSMSPEELAAMLDEIAHTFASLNLTHLSGDRLTRAIDSLVVRVTPRAGENSVDVYVSADLGGTLFSRHLPLIHNYEGPDTIAVASGVEVLATPVEVVLAFDVSKSMQYGLDGNFVGNVNDSRMEIVKRAAKELVTALNPNSLDRIAIGLVPWHTYVRLSEGRRTHWTTKGWAKYPLRRTYYQPYACLSGQVSICHPHSEDQNLPATSPLPWRGCLDENRLNATNHAAHVEPAKWFHDPATTPFAQAIYPSLQASSYDCLSEPYPPGFSHQYCFQKPYAISQLGCHPADPYILPLTTDPIEINEAIDDLTPVGDATYSAVGVLWGQRLLTHTYRTVWGGVVHPVNATIPANAGVRKAIVLLTDGEDNHCGNLDPTCTIYGIGIPREEACAAVKAQGTEIFVIAAMSSVTGSLADGLRACSSESSGSGGPYVFLDHSDEDSLTATFTAIANQLHIVRRTH